MMFVRSPVAASSLPHFVAALNRVAISAAALCAGFVAGADAAVDVRTPSNFVTGALAGGLVVPLTVASLLTGRATAAAHIGPRVVGSWIAAIGLVMRTLGLCA